MIILFVTLMCGIITREVFASENLALHKPAYQSTLSMFGKYDANNSVDGSFNQDPHQCAHGNDNSGGPNWLVIDLLKVYYITRVILTPRSDQDKVINSRMDYPYIGITNMFSELNNTPVRHGYPLCRQSPYKADISINMSIECRPNTPPGRYVIVQQPVTGPGYLTVCEIQVFRKNNTEAVTECANGFYGEYCDKLCYCDKNVACDRNNGTCPNKCDDNWTGEHCDTRIPEYRKQFSKCFYNNTPGSFLVSTANGSCLDECSGFGFDFAAVWNNSACLCTEKIESPFIPCEQFNESCSIYPSRNCTYGNKLQLYSVCPNGTYGYNCSLKCNCVDNTRCRYMNGYCELGCSPGWTGTSCNIRDCSQHNGGCDANERCTSISSEVVSCECKSPDFQRENSWSPCTEVQKSSINMPAIIGGVVGVVVGLIVIVVIAILVYMIRKRPKKDILPSSSYQDEEKENDNKTLVERTQGTKLENMPHYVQSNMQNFTTEFRNLYVENDTSLKNLQVEYNRNLDRFKNIIPYNFNRIILTGTSTETHSNYINASYIKGILKSTLIATQAPKIQSLNDFWKMVWQEDIGIIIMLCNLVERNKNKCEQYWPTLESMDFNELTVSYVKSFLWPYFILTELSLTNANDEQRHVTHLHFNKWPDHGVPENAAYFLAFCSHFRRLHENKKCGVVVHCSAGVGRTGCFLAVYDLLKKGYQGLDINVPECVNNLRKQRMKMVEKQIQYNYVNESLAEEVKLGPTTFNRDEFIKFSEDLMSSNNKRNQIQHQHEKLHVIYSAINKPDSNVKLITSSFNFHLVSNNTTQLWSDISEDTNYLIIFDADHAGEYLPKDEQPISVDNKYISLISEKDTESGKRFEIKITKQHEESGYENIENCTHVYENTDVKNMNILKVFLVKTEIDYMELLPFMEIFQEVVDQNSVSVFLKTNRGLGNFFMAACNIINQYKTRGEVAIFQNFLELHHVTGYQTSLKSYEKIYQMIYEYIMDKSEEFIKHIPSL